jgi:predicted nucleic acid-binding protein
MSAIIVDTDILINFLRGKEKARDFFVSQLNKAVLCCSVITVAEIYAGMKEHEKAKTDELLNSLDIVPVDRSIAEKAGHYKKNIKGHGLELDDCLIAATAFVKKARLATGNGKHYPMSDIKKVVVPSK